MVPTHRVVITVLQAGLSLAGIAWKIKEEFPLFDLPDPAFGPQGLYMHWLHEGDWNWTQGFLRILESQAILPTDLLKNWPWFSLHILMYVSQLTPLVGMMALESVHQKKPLAAVFTVMFLSLTSPLLGFSSAMPLTSILFLALHQAPSPPQKTPLKRAGGEETGRLGGWGLAGPPWRRLLLGSIFLGSTVAHVGAWAVSLSATLFPSLYTDSAAEALYVMHSLCGVPSDAPIAAAAVAATDSSTRWIAALQAARLRQINEMIGTSSGFLLAVGLLCDALAATAQQLSAEAILWMFFVSLVAGPAAGGAAVLLARDWVFQM